MEDYVLKELSKRVLARDKVLQKEREFEAMQKATIAALSEITSLPESEIDQMAKEVHREHYDNLRKKKKQKAFIQIAVALAAVALCIFFLVITKNSWMWVLIALSGIATVWFLSGYKTAIRKRNIIIDNFDDKNMRWSQTDKLLQHRYFKEGSYFFEVGRKDWCYWDSIEVNLPENFDLSLRSRWVKGEFGTYGPIILDTAGDYLSVEHNGKAQAAYSLRKNKEWIVSKDWKSAGYSAQQKKDNIQRIDMRGKHFDYYVNDQLVYSGTASELGDFEKVGLRVCDKQCLEFKEIKITDSETGDVIFFDDFSQANQLWEPKTDYEYKKSYTEKGYVIQASKDDWNFWSKQSVNLTGDCDISLKMRYLSGENSGFGLVLYENTADYRMFVLRPDGEARYLNYVSGKLKGTILKIPTDHRSEGEQSHFIHLKKRDKKLDFFVNETFIERVAFPVKRIKQLGVLASGHQSVLFERLICEEK